MKKIFPSVKIDWPNHLIGFFSALFGILIAFELDDWRERQNQLELAANAMERMTTEINFNQNILHTNTARNIKSIEILRQLSANLNDQLLFAGSPEEIDSINSQFSDYIFIHAEAVNPANRFPAHVGVGSIRMISQHTSA